ncbi:MAG: protein phosphatase 2C domain-containing protein [Anaerolineae bacterium]|nr:protein phosphatase 2C domain-containing protein [Anaerolineae bacterium]MCB0203861.1 protein phosphatase 2C domain-containing protein [Anaerolineae bacterium]
MSQLAAPLIWGETNVGKQRNHNEDQVYPDTRHKTSLRPPTPDAVQARGYLLVVADGIGGAQVGDTAANFAVRTVTDHYYADPRPLSLDKLLQSAVELANTSVYNYVRNSPAITQAGCTLTAAAIRGNELNVAHVGDSRAYLIQEGVLYPLTTDHNVAQMIASGQQLPGGQPLAGNMLARSLGAGPTVAVDTRRFMLKPGDTVLLCSDGLHGVVSNDEIKQIAASETPEKGARKLIDLANARGGPDNISVVIARIPGSAAPAAAAAGGARSNRITALAIAVLALAAVLVLMLFALNSFRDGEPATTPTVIAGVDTATPDASASGSAAVDAAATSMAVAGSPSDTPQPTNPPQTATQAATARPPTATPIPSLTPTVRPTNTPIPSNPVIVIPTLSRPTQTNLSPSPVIVAPPEGSEQRDKVTLQWSFDRTLLPNQQFLVTLRTDANQQPPSLILQTRERSIEVPFIQNSEFFKEDGTTYYWKVVVIENGGRQVSQPSTESTFVLKRELPQPPGSGQPPEETPTTQPEPPTLTPEPPTPTKEPPPPTD